MKNAKLKSLKERIKEKYSKVVTPVEDIKVEPKSKKTKKQSV